SARAIMGSLALERNLAALAKTARGLAKHAKKSAARGLDAAHDALDVARRGAPPVDYAVVNSGLRDLLALAQVWPEASARQIARGAQRLARRARKAWRKGHDRDLSEDKRHQWRQREKDRLYAARLLDEVWPASRPSRASANRKLVKALGREHDLALLAARLTAAPAMAGESDDAGAALKAVKSGRRRRDARARRIAARLHAGRA